jgi:hypothetical protein
MSAHYSYKWKELNGGEVNIKIKGLKNSEN